MPKYQCPECEAVLKRDSAIEPGKKIKCPKCETIFKATPMRDGDEDEEEEKGAKKKKKAKAESKKATDDDEEGGSYGFVKEAEETEEEKEKKGVHYGSLRDKFAKSKRGPAMSMLVTPSNIIMGEGIVICLGSLAGFIFAIWPFIFSQDSLPRDRRNEQILIAAGSVGGFLLGAFICYIASCMNELRYYQLVWAGVIIATLPLIAALVMAIIFAFMKGEFWAYPLVLFQGFLVGIVKAIQALLHDTVKGGFEETIQKAADLKYG